ncbi:probable glutamate receptor [Scylla paramamosain]|uniref:probable glutamate receptor n=1 Tax=Scylla paramamosain TaxID=85552 RepID=UPI003082A95C
MRVCRHLMLICLTLLPVCGRSSMEGITFTTETTDLQENWISLAVNSTVNYKAMSITEKQMIINHKTLPSSTTRNPGGFSWKDSEALLTLMLGIIRAELSQCILTIVWDAVLADSVITESLSRLPNVKQIVESGEVGKLLWQAKQCRGYIFLLTDPSSLMDQAEAAHDAWDYSGRMVIVGLSRSHIDTITRTKKGRKTEHILGIVQDNFGHYIVLMNQLYNINRLVHVFTWQTTVTTPQKYSTYLNIKPNSEISIKSHSLKLPTSIPNFTQKFFPDKTKDFQGSILNVVWFLFPPEIMYSYDEKGNVKVRYGGNVRLVETVAEIFNFTPRFMEPPGGSLWGHQLPNGSWTGMVGMFERDEGDLGIANLFISALGGRNEHQHYTAPFGQENTCFMMKKGTSTPRWQSLALPFGRDTWIAILVMAFLLGPIFFALSRPRITRDEKLTQQSMAFINLYTFGVHLRVAQTQIPVSLSLQIFVAFLWVYVIIVLEAYSAKLVSFLTVERIPEGINTIEELYYSSFPIYGNTRYYIDSLELAQNIHARKLAERYIILREFDDAYKYLMGGHGAYIASANNLIYMISLYSKNGNPTLRLMKECFQPYNTALGVQSHSPLKRNLDQAVNWVREAGLPYQWRRETLMIIRQERMTAPSDSADASEPEGEKRVSFSLEHLQGVFIMFGVGCGLSLLVFTSELPIY